MEKIALVFSIISGTPIRLTAITVPVVFTASEILKGLYQAVSITRLYSTLLLYPSALRAAGERKLFLPKNNRSQLHIIHR